MGAVFSADVDFLLRDCLHVFLTKPATSISMERNTIELTVHTIITVDENTATIESAFEKKLHCIKYYWVIYCTFEYYYCAILKLYVAFGSYYSLVDH